MKMSVLSIKQTTTCYLFKTLLCKTKLNMNLSKMINSNLFTQHENNPSQFGYFKPQNRNELPKNYSCTPSIMLLIMLNKYFILLYIMIHVLP